MQPIYTKTLQDLEFPTVLEQLSARCNTELGKTAALELKPFTDKDSLLEQLKQTSEYLSSFDNDNRIPNHGFDGIDKELKLLNIENSSSFLSFPIASGNAPFMRFISSFKILRFSNFTISFGKTPVKLLKAKFNCSK